EFEAALETASRAPLTAPNAVAPTPASQRMRWAAATVAATKVSHRRVLLAAATVIVISLGTALTLRACRADNGSPTIATLGRAVVAPLDNRTGDSSFDAVGLMAADWITEG